MTRARIMRRFGGRGGGGDVAATHLMYRAVVDQLLDFNNNNNNKWRYGCVHIIRVMFAVARIGLQPSAACQLVVRDCNTRWLIFIFFIIFF